MKDKRFDKLMEIAVFYAEKAWFPDPINSEDKRSVEIIKESRRAAVKSAILATLPLQPKRKRV